ncbi:MAG: tRNA (adenosine(37)-N6)-dimethylallyltransferase MiaA [Ignavibacteria bacterium RIFOXYA2_FULL_37_17]|nr:MAG: tRNA (adenosine(37)-N6)-dimethylallyltransferase MiaA [Ignavibacteria bacterium RIFOXYA2_FULL_37_17]
MERKVIVIVGPTCSGKTKVGISLAQKLNSEIISADSRQIYKKLTIGTAKPTQDELRKMKHHFIDLLEPDEDYNVSRFETDSLKVIDELITQGKIPIVVGGSGLYIKALTEGIFNSVDTDDDYREELKVKREKFGNEYLYDELKKVDPQSASGMLPQNWKRIMRALEVFHLTGEPIWKMQENYERKVDYNFILFGLDWDRKILYANIEKRVDEMIESGLMDEVKNILSLGYSKNINSLNTVGYKEIISYLDNEITLEHAIELIKRNTRRYAKRQMTWFRKTENINWLTCDENTSSEQLISLILKKM